MRALLRRFAFASLLATLAAPSFAAATIVINNLNAAGVGFNDPTVVAPVGGNTGTTLGQQRLNCFQQAANIWGATLSSNVTIKINAQFSALTCTATSAVLGSAGAISIFRDFPSAPVAGHWYSQALANKLNNADLSAGGADINANFNINLGTATCLSGSGWYYGFDHNEGALIDLVAVLEHEFAHGLGFQTFTSGSTGAYASSFPSVWDQFLYDETTGLHWDQETPTQRVASALTGSNLTWDGPHVTAAGATLLNVNPPQVVVPFAPFSLTPIQSAFGPALTTTGVTAQAVVAVDALAPTGDGCEAIGPSVAGKIAVIDRGTCTFVVKVKNAQNAGAIGVILVNNAAGALAPGGADPTITIPSVGITQADGTLLKNAIAGGVTNVTLRLNPTGFAGRNPASGRVQMYAPNPFQGGSSVSHWDVTATPNLLMEPAINADLTNSLDLTTDLFRDIGWLPSLLGVPGGGPAARVAMAASPNPSRGLVKVHFDLTSDDQVTLTLFDIAGREVRTLANARFTAGSHDLTWDGLDAAGRPATPGVYLARLKGPNTAATQHIVLMN